MKKTLSIILVVMSLSSASLAQGIYIRGGGGYGFPIATASLGEKYFHTQTYDANTSTSASTYSVDAVKGSYGAGLNFNFAVGFKFNANFIFELATQYLISNKITTSAKDVYKYTDLDPQNNYTYTDYTNSRTSAGGLFLNPSFIFSAGFGKAAPYGRFGLVIGSPKISGSSLAYYNGDGIDSTARKWEYTKGMSFGFQGAIGMNWKLTDKLDIYTEINYISMTYYPGEYNLTQYVTSNGNMDFYDNLPGTYLIDKKTIFKKKFDPNAVNNDVTKARVELPQAEPFSSVSIQVGIRFSLWNIVE